mmetsp:Transcript_103737/g.309855  ORF Transcript_103737/g.309855 Transcript_103737/m.309855 type:complete len:249 (+) Transcript_103737:487-1233(+)
MVLDDADNALLVLPPAMLQHVLDDVVPVRILGQLWNALQDVLEDFLQLTRSAMLQEPLDDAAAVHVGCHSLRLILNGLDDEVDGVRGHLLDALLDDVVAVHTLYALDHILAELRGDHLLRLPGRMLNRLLDDAAPTRLVRESQDVSLQTECQLPPLLGSPDVEELDHHEVAERVAREVGGLRHDDIAHGLLLIRVGLVQLVLKEAAPEVVLGKLEDVRHDLAQRHLAAGALPPDLLQGQAPVRVRIIV